MAAIAERMLETLETIATGGKLLSRSHTNGSDRHAPVSESEASRYRDADTPGNGIVVEVANAEAPISHQQKEPMKSDTSEPENPFYI